MEEGGLKKSVESHGNICKGGISKAASPRLHFVGEELRSTGWRVSRAALGMCLSWRQSPGRGFWLLIQSSCHHPGSCCFLFDSWSLWEDSDLRWDRTKSHAWECLPLFHKAIWTLLLFFPALFQSGCFCLLKAANPSPWRGMKKSTNKVSLKALCFLQKKNLYVPFSLIIELQRGKIKWSPSCAEPFYPTCQ